MKKAFCLFVLFFAAIPAFAQYQYRNYNYQSYTPKTDTRVISKGDTLLSLMVGGSLANDDIDGVEWGSDGAVSYLGQAMFFPSEYIGFGAEFSGNNFFSVYNTGAYSGLRITGNVYNVMYAMRFNFNPKSSFRVYIPVGAGMALAKLKEEHYLIGSYTHDSTEFAWYAGFGMESSISDRVVLGAELRYNSFNFKFDDGEKVTPDYFSALFKVGVKF